MARYTVALKVRGACDRCGQVYRLAQLRAEFVRGKPTGWLTCPSCWDADHPQNYLDAVCTDDPQRVRDARPVPMGRSRDMNWQDIWGISSRMTLSVGVVEVRP